MDLYTEKKYIEILWAGNTECLWVLSRLRAYKRHEEILRWLIRNDILGKKIIDFFHDVEGNEGRGIIKGVNNILKRIDNDRYNKDPLTIKDLK